MQRNHKLGIGAVMLSAFLSAACGQPGELERGEPLATDEVGAVAAPLTVAAGYDAVLKVPRCTGEASGCDTVNLVTGRGSVGPERNAPNTLGGSCADESSGGYKSDESIERVKVYTTDGSTLAFGKQVTLEVDVWAWSGYTSDALDLYYAADANSPAWTYLTTLVPAGAGAQTLKVNYTLPSGGSAQAVRAAFRYGGSVGVCAPGAYSDRDDLVFSVRAPAPTPAQLSTRIAAGLGFTLQVRQDGTVWSYGSNGYGRLGDGSGVDQPSPVQVASLTQVKAVAAGWTHSLALKQDGTVWAWGNNSDGQLGDGTQTQRDTPVQVLGLSNVVAIHTLNHHSVALKQDGTVWAWGAGLFGSLGNGSSASRSTPVQVTGLSDVVSIAVGAGHSVALKQDGTVWAWGSNSQGQLADGTTTDRYTPVQSLNISGVKAIAAGFNYTMALKQDGIVWAWGENQYGELGDGTTTNRRTPMPIAGLTDVTLIMPARAFYVVALRADGSLWTWGSNSSGQLGDGTRTSRLLPAQATVFSGAVAVQAGLYHTVALKPDGSVWGWGGQNGELGNGYFHGSLTAVQAPGTVSVQ